MCIRWICRRPSSWRSSLPFSACCSGGGVEDTLAEEIGKWIVMGIFIIGIFEVFAYVLAPFFYHMIYDKKK